MDLAERVRSGEFKSIRAQLAADLRLNVLKSLDERGGAQELVRQQYSGRYPFELLQNANDASLDAGIRGRACFLLTDTALLVADNGFGFGEGQIDAICSLGRSSKGPDSAIGHKGLGFKSVGEITDRPQIVSEQASFQFDSHRLQQELLTLFETLPSDQRFPVYAFPFPVEDGDLGPDSDSVRRLRQEGLRTVIRLPLREGVTRKVVEEHLTANLRHRLLLFLPGIDHLELRGTQHDFSAEVARQSSGGAERVLVETRAGDEEWLIYRGSTAPDKALLAPLGDAFTKLETVSFAVAVPMEDDGQPGTDESFPLHVYFPTEERPGLRVAVHAEWVLSMDRRRLAATPEALPFNRWLLHEVTSFLREHVAVDLLARCEMSARAVTALLPVGPQPQDATAASQLRGLWESELLGTAFLPCLDDTLRAPTEVRLLPTSVPTPALAHQLVRLDASRTLRADVEAVDAVRRFVAGASTTAEMSISEFLGELRAPSAGSAKEYYSFLLRWRDATVGSALVAELRKARCVLTTSGQVVAPAAETVFFPRLRGDVSIPADIPVPIAALPDVDGLPGLLKDLGVKDFEWADLIRDFLIRILEDQSADPDQRRRALEGLRAYQAVRRSGSDELTPVLGRVLLPARTADGGKHGLRPAAATYFGAAWSGSPELEVIYGPFGVPEFLDVPAPKDTDERHRDEDFYRMLGVIDHPRIREAKSEGTHGYMVGAGRHPHRGPVFAEWLAQPDVSRASRCQEGNGHPQSQQHRLSYQLDRHVEIIESGDPVRLMALWTQLAKHWGATYAGATQAVFRCVHGGSHAGDRERDCESVFAYVLRSRPWVPVAYGGEPTLVRPSEAWIDATELPKRIRERVPRISEAMYQAPGAAEMARHLQLTDAGRPRSSDLLELLAAVAVEADEHGGAVSRDVERAAKYIQRTLDDVLRVDTDVHPSPETVRLLTSHRGRLGFAPQPPYADDPFLRETWEAHRPVLEAEAGLTRLTSHLGLVRLDDVVRPTAVAFDEQRGAVLDAVRRQLDAIKPYVLALAAKDNSRAVERVRPGLRRLELIVCGKLTLHYEHDGVEVQRDSACYIATRRERESGRRPVNIGTAYLEIDPTSREPDWFAFGRQLAQHLNVPTLSDAITMLLKMGRADRDRLMTDRSITEAEVADARVRLDLELEDDDEPSSILDPLLAGGTDHRVDATAAFPSQGSGEDAPTVGSSGARTGSSGESAGRGEGSAGSAAPAPSAAPEPPPPVDYASVTVLDASPGYDVEPRSGRRRRSDEAATGGSSSAPAVQTEEERRRIGKRGEEIVYIKERERLAAMGKDPDTVHWASRSDEFSAYDIVSCDADNQRIYIEVKATRGDDPNESFFISKNELLEATFHRSRYYVYRVTAVDTATPQIVRIADPMRLIRDGKGQLLLAKASMQLSVDIDDEPI